MELPSSNIIDTSEALVTFINQRMSVEPSLLLLYVDLEGVKLSRTGSISLIQIYMADTHQVFIIDVHVLGHVAFSATGSANISLKTVFESEKIVKYFFDVRNDSDALYSLFDIQLNGVRDIQLLELAARRHSKTFLHGLATCIENDCPLSPERKKDWLATKKKVNAMFDPKSGGVFEVFNERPLQDLVLRYCVQDVQYMPLLAQTYEKRIKRPWAKKVTIETALRLLESRDSAYEPHGQNKSLGPLTWTKATIPIDRKDGGGKNTEQQQEDISGENNTPQVEHIRSSLKQFKLDPEKQQEGDCTVNVEFEIRKWSSDIPKTRRDRQKVKPMNILQLCGFIQGAFQLAQSSPDAMREVMILLASKGGEVRLAEILDQSTRVLLEHFGGQLMPFYQALHMALISSARESPVMRQSCATLLRSLYGIGGQRAIRGLNAAIQYLSSDGKDHEEYVVCVVLLSKLIDIDDSRALTTVTSKFLELIENYTRREEFEVHCQKLQAYLNRLSRSHSIKSPRTTDQEPPKTWSMYPNLHEGVSRILEEECLLFSFYNEDDPTAAVLQHDTSIKGRFRCGNRSCNTNGWSSKKVAITIRLYTTNRYNARVYFQRCESCESLSRPKLDDSYATRVAYRIKRWSGIPMDLPTYSTASKGPHQKNLCEGCRNGRCANG